MNLVFTIVLLTRLPGVEIVLGLGHSMSVVDIFVPFLASVGSTLVVENGVVLENTGLLYVFLVVRFLLFLFLLTKFLVFGFGQAFRDIRRLRELTNLELYHVCARDRNEELANTFRSMYSSVIHFYEPKTQLKKQYSRPFS